MKRREYNFNLWCHSATILIRYKPDRRAVSQELMGHLEDHREALMEKGLSAEEASAQALEAMGSAQEIALQLAAIHKPWLGYLSSLIKAAAILTAALAVFYTLTIGGSFLSALTSTRNFDSIPVNYGPLDHYCHPNVSDSSDGYRFKVTEAGYSKLHSELYFQLEVIYLPWISKGDITSYIWATDSFGNYYESIADAANDDPTCIVRGGGLGSSLIFVSSMRITGFDCDAQWVELHYDRDGRDIALRIDLTGGGKDG